MQGFPLFCVDIILYISCEEKNIIDNQGNFKDTRKMGRQFTWRELSHYNKQHNAHVAYRGKVGDKYTACTAQCHVCSSISDKLHIIVRHRGQGIYSV
jgi:hypothetical protein